MSDDLDRLPASRIRYLDALALTWCVFCLLLGGWVAYEIWQLSNLGEGLAASGQALDKAGIALQELRKIPVIGDTPGTIGDELRTTADIAVQQGNEATTTTRRLAVLLGLAVSIAPLAPVLWLYLPLRNARRREVSQLRELLAGTDRSESDAYLAHRALTELSPAKLSKLTDTPYTDVHAGRHRRLADAELARLGLQRHES